MNEEVLKMIDTLHARLDDVREAVESLPKEAPQYAEKLDKVMAIEKEGAAWDM